MKSQTKPKTELFWKSYRTQNRNPTKIRFGQNLQAYGDILIDYVSYVVSVSMVMFSTFEQSVEFIYKNIIQKRKQDCSKSQQLGVTCLAGYTAGAVGTIISNPADVVVSSLYNNKAKNVLQVDS